MSGREENTDDQVMKDLCEKSKLLAFVEGQNEYEKSMKRTFNAGSPSNKPKAFVKPKNSDEVSNVLEYASANHLHLSVLSGGHDPKGLAIIRDGIVLDMTAMKNMDIDVETETAWVEAGVTVKELDDFTFALSCCLSITGRFCYLPIAATKLGELLHDINVFCREAEDEITLNILDLGEEAFLRLLWQRNRDVNFREPAAASQVSMVSLLNLPFMQVKMETKGHELQKLFSVAALLFSMLLDLLKTFQKKSAFEKFNTLCFSWLFQIIQIIINQLESAPVGSNPHVIGIELVGGEINRKSPDSCAYVHRDALFLYSVQAVWKSQVEANGNAHSCRKWAETSARSLLAHSLGSYQNYADCGEATTQERLENYFGKKNFERLKGLKHKYDPNGVLRKEHFVFCK
ncbi:uncharacterized FAD-linked oxidoreductase YgaK-like [Acropora muricata]|uniref:uncharacterized FAD-linked oxidoreductase YgaK-like n=1 Tax=Acropora muricata TaxID=159855 RepID=UPI0034E5CB84